MPHLVDYQTVLQTLSASGLICTYHNSGSFAPDPRKAVAIVGWTLGPDDSIRPDMREHISTLQSPAELVDFLVRYWTASLQGEIWIMPASHWAFELTYGNADWLPSTLESIGISPAELASRNDGTAIAFGIHEAGALQTLITALLTQSASSDFTAAWPTKPTVAMIHHHGQLWWRTTDAELAERLRNPITISSLKS